MQLLTYSSLYPSAGQPQHGVFVENRLRHLVATGHVSAKVVAPIPWFPSGARVFGGYGALARAPAVEECAGVTVVHPRYPVIPKIGMNVSPLMMYLALRPVIGEIISSGYDFDLIDAHYFYPDGVAAAMLARHFF